MVVVAATLSAGRVWIGEGIGSVMVAAVTPVVIVTAALAGRAATADRTVGIVGHVRGDRAIGPAVADGCSPGTAAGAGDGGTGSAMADARSGSSPGTAAGAGNGCSASAPVGAGDGCAVCTGVGVRPAVGAGDGVMHQVRTEVGAGDGGRTVVGMAVLHQVRTEVGAGDGARTVVGMVVLHQVRSTGPAAASGPMRVFSPWSG